MTNILFTDRYCFIGLILIVSTFLGCNKNDPPISFPSKMIKSFSFLQKDNPGNLTIDIQGTLSNDTILVYVPVTVSITSLTPSVTYEGKSLSPENHSSQDFSRPVNYVVTATDGAMKTYTVIVTYLSNAKRITSFQFKTSENPGLTKDIAGVIGGDTILIIVPSALVVSHLKPAVIYEGKSISPDVVSPYDFSSSVKYTVEAEDGTTKKYTVIVGKNAAVFFGSSDGYLYAVNGITSGLYWKHDLGSQVTGITVSNGVVYAGNTKGTLYAVDALTGNVKWTYQKPGGTFTIPTVHNNKVYVGFIASGLGGTRTQKLLALDASSGGLMWEQLVMYNGYALYNPTFVNDIIYISSWSYGIFAFDAMDGSLKWRYQTGLSGSSPTVSDGVVYTGTEGTVVTALDASTGDVKWSYTNNEPNSNSSATVAGDLVYIGANLYMYAIGRTDGKLKWRCLAKGGEAGIGDNTHSTRGHFSTPFVANGTVYAGNDDYLTYAIDAETGVLKRSYGGSMEIRNTSPAPVVANGILYTTREDENLYAFDAYMLTVRWTFPTGGLISTNTCVVDADGNVYYTGDAGDQQ